MSDVLIKIKEAVITGKVRFTNKALTEMLADDLDEDEIIESIINAPCVHKKVVSRRRGLREPLYILLGLTQSGLIIYTKGRFHHHAGIEVLYILISSKRSVVIR